MISILYIDDDSMVLSFFKDALERKGYTVHAAGDPTEGEKILAQHKIDLVILDVVMPEKSGLEIFDNIKQRFSNMPVLFATGYPDSFALDSDEKAQRWTKGFADGMTDIVYKPFTAARIESKIKALVETASYS